MKPAPPSATPGRRRPRAWFLGLGMAAVLLTAVPVAWFVVRGSVVARFRRAEAEADRLDPGWRLSEIEARRAAESPPEAENSARHVREILGMLPVGWPRASSPSAGRDGAELGADELLTIVSESPPEARLDPAEASALREVLDALAPAVEEARRLVDAGEGYTPLPLDRPVIAYDAGHVQDARAVARLLVLDAARRVEDGEIDGALESARAILGLARSLGDEPILVAQLVRMAFEGMAVATAERSLARGEASDGALAALMDDLALAEGRPLLLHGLRGERAGLIQTAEDLASGRVSLATIAGGGASGADFLLRGETFVRHNQAMMLEAMNEAVEIARTPRDRPLAAWDRWEEEFRLQKNPTARLAGALSAALLPGVEGAANADARRRASLASARLALAMERQRLALARWPEGDATDLARLLVAPALDPFVGGPLRLARREDGPTIYAVGPDLVDDGGRLDTRRGAQPGYDVGFRLWDAPLRGRAPVEGDLPEDVFAGDSP